MQNVKKKKKKKKTPKFICRMFKKKKKKKKKNLPKWFHFSINMADFVRPKQNYFTPNLNEDCGSDVSVE